ncbi:MAG: DUF937 domain-containing protein [Candidatus Peribacteria bacterium]|nr:MAG: DUF937 domain-containing protein [Candidatus Peribacteria bacterium]
MNNLFNTISSTIDQKTLEQIGQQVGLTPEQTKDIGSGVLSTIFGGLAKQATTAEGAQAITTAAQSHDSSILDDVVGAFQDGKIDLNDGSKILGHIFG